jgi:3-methylfumaryl-CoA hydratase
MLLDRWPVNALAATLGLDSGIYGDSRVVPPLWHWLYFRAATPRSDIGLDGHPADAPGMPGESPHRRVFASARLWFERPLELGRPTRQTESVGEARRTQGRSGALQIVTFEYQYFQDDELCIREQRDIIYRAPPTTAASEARSAARQTSVATSTPADTPDVATSETVTPDAVMLFRFSALTFNAHRIHYDQGYAQGVEGYRERVVHGPLVAILLADLFRKRVAAPVRRFDFRAHRPLFVDEPIRMTWSVAEQHLRLQALDPTGAVAMEAAVWS